MTSNDGDETQEPEPFESAVRRVQALARSYLQPGEGSVVDEFLAERRRDAQQDDNG